MKSQILVVNGKEYGIVKNYKGLYSLSLNKKPVGHKFIIDDFGNLTNNFYMDCHKHSISE